jgi:hypothetical protein
MIIRVMFFIVVFSLCFWALYYSVFRTDYFNKDRVKEISKTGFITGMALASSFMALVFWAFLEKYIL